MWRTWESCNTIVVVFTYFFVVTEYLYSVFSISIYFYHNYTNSIDISSVNQID